MRLPLQGSRLRLLAISVSAIVLAGAFLFPASASASDPTYSVSATPKVVHMGDSPTILSTVVGGTPNCDYLVGLTVTGPSGTSTSVTIHLYTLVSGKGNVSVSYPGFFPGGSTGTPGKYTLSATFTCGGYAYGYGYGTGSATGAFTVLPPPTATLKVVSVDQDGNPIYGYPVHLSQNGHPVAAGTTSYAHSIYTLEKYAVAVDSSYRGCNFSHWQDTSSTNASRSISITAFTRLIAVYTCVRSTLVVVTEHASGGPISGYYTTLAQNGTTIPESCAFSTCAFQVDNGQTYVVSVDNYRMEMFSQWSNGKGSTYPWGGSMAVTIPPLSSPTTVVAVADYAP
jgi:hypothetical protein